MLETLWPRLLSSLEHKIPEAALDTWVRSSRLMAVEGDRLQIAAPNKFSRDWLAGRSPPGPRPARPAPASTTSGLNPRYTFETFVVGSSNQFAQAACQAVAELPSKAYNPLFIYGGVGLGKTPLLHAVGHQIPRLFPGMRLLYLSS